MKRLLTTLLLLTLLLSSLLATNAQKVWSTQNPIFSQIETLYILEGRSLPSSTGPWSTAELARMLSKVNRDTYPELYDHVAQSLGKEPELSVDEAFGMSLTGSAAFTAYAHSNTDFTFPYDYVDNYIFRTKNAIPTLDLGWESWVGQNLYGFFSYQLENEKRLKGRTFDSYPFNFDLAWFCPEGFHQVISQNPPLRAFVSFGTDDWNLQFGRDRLVSGSGETGNLMLSDTFRFHNMLRFSAFGSRFKYTFHMSFLPHPIEAKGGSRDGLFYYMGHKIEARFLNDRLSIALTDAIIYQSETGFLDLRFVNPMAFFHNYFIKSSANSIAGIEASYGISKHFNAYLQLAIDDISSPVESSDGDSTPTAMGFLLGIKGSHLVGSGVLKTSLEGAYTFPFLYLRSKDGNAQSVGDWGLSYIGYYRALDYVRNIPLFLGYTYGGDALVGDLKASYSVLDKWDIGAELFVMLHGSKNFDSLFELGTETGLLSGNVTFTSYAELYGNYYLKPGLKVFGQYDAVVCAKKVDHQFVLGIEAEF